MVVNTPSPISLNNYKKLQIRGERRKKWFTFERPVKHFVQSIHHHSRERESNRVCAFSICNSNVYARGLLSFLFRIRSMCFRYSTVTKSKNQSIVIKNQIKMFEEMYNSEGSMYFDDNG